MVDTRLPKCVMFGELVEGSFLGGAGKEVDGVPSGRPQSFRYQDRPVDDHSPGRGGMAYDSQTRGGAFHDEVDRGREGQGCITSCNSVSERDGKDQKEGSTKQANSYWFARHY